LHLYADRNQKLKGVQTLASFRAVKSLAWQMFPSPDLLLLGGDLAQDELADSYRVLGDDLLGWSDAVRVTPGNHCSPSAMERTLFQMLSIPPMAESAVTLDAWHVIPLNSHHAPSSPTACLEKLSGPDWSVCYRRAPPSICCWPCTITRFPLIARGWMR